MTTTVDDLMAKPLAGALKIYWTLDSSDRIAPTPHRRSSRLRRGRHAPVSAIRAANRGETAIELLRQEPFDLLVVDFKMPGMNGFEVLEQARRIRPNMVCILMTAHGTPDLINEATQAGFNCILSKPFTPSELRRAVDTVLAGRA